jgi:hypothetical protein
MPTPRSLLMKLSVLACLGALAALCVGCSPATRTIISLTFADGLASQHTAMTMMRAHGMVDTFYIIPDPVGTSPYYPGQTCTPSRTPATRSAGTRCTTST